MAIATATAILGAAVIGAGASTYASSKAASKAKNAANYAADQNAAVNREIYNQTRTDLSPYRDVGTGALAALSTRLGLTPIPANGARPQGQQANAGAYSALPGSRPAAAASAAPQDNRMFGTGGPVDPNARDPNAPGVANLTTIQGGYGGNAGQAAPTAAPMAAGGGTDYARLFSDRPDVMAEYQRASAAGDPNSPAYTQKGLQSPEAYADYWLANKPPEDAYNAPQVGAPQQSAGAPTDPNAPPPEYYTEQYAPRPDALQVPDYARPDAMQRDAAMQFQDYGSGPQFSWDPSQIAKDPGFIFETGETAKGVNANFAAKSKLRSGDAVKALQDRLFGVAHTYGNDYFSRALQGYGANRNAFESNRNYGTDLTKYQQGRRDNIFSEDRAFNDDAFVNDRSYGTNLALQLQGRNDNIFSDDRNFAANRNDQATANLFNLTNVGANAAAGTAQAGQNYANGVTNSNNQRAAATGNAAIANAQNMTNLFGSAANAVGSYYGARRV